MSRKVDIEQIKKKKIVEFNNTRCWSLVSNRTPQVHEYPVAVRVWFPKARISGESHTRILYIHEGAPTQEVVIDVCKTNLNTLFKLYYPY